MYLFFELDKTNNQIEALINEEKKLHRENDSELDIACEVAKKVFFDLNLQNQRISWITANENAEKLKNHGIVVKTAQNANEIEEKLKNLSNNGSIFVVAKKFGADHLFDLNVRIAGAENLKREKEIWARVALMHFTNS